jgi:hypothetical protein
MGAFSIWHILIIAALGFWFVPMIPTWKILSRMGLPGPLALLLIVPFAALILLFVVAFSRWPNAAGSAAEDP